MITVEISLHSLVPNELEKSLLTAELRCPSLFSANLEGIENIVINLEAVLWVDIGAAAQLVVLIDGWARAVSNIKILMPSSKNLVVKRAENERQARISAHRFLRYIRFPSAIEYISSKRSASIQLFADGIKVANVNVDEDFPETYTRIVPLHWIGLGEIEVRKQLAQHLTHALQNSSEGVDGPDAQALSNVVLHELIENVVEHSQVGSSALVCGFAHVNAIHIAKDRFNSEELPYLLATENAEQPVLEIIVGDSGRGIIETLQRSYREGPGRSSGNLTKKGAVLPHNIVRWAFDRWSTEKNINTTQRGVRGLFRVDRLVAKYFGQIAVRTGNTLFVREHLVNTLPIERFNKAPHKYVRLTGTIIRIRMTGVTVAGITETMSRYRDGERNVGFTSLVGISPPKSLLIEELYETGFGVNTERSIIELLGHVESRPTSLYVLLAAQGVGNRSLERALRFLCLHASPVPIYALNIQCSLDELDSIVLSINAESDNSDQAANGSASYAEELDIILVAHHSGVVRWIGLPTLLAELLLGLDKGGIAFISSELYKTVLKYEARLKAFFVLEEGGHTSPFKQLRCIADLSAFRAHVGDIFREMLQKDDYQNHSSVWHDGPYLTPTLRFVNKWVRIDQLVAKLKLGSFQSIAFELARAIETSFNATSPGGILMFKGFFLAMEEKSSLRVCEALQVRFGFHPLPSVAGGQTVRASEANRNTPVVVYADLISSGESLRRAAQNVLRRGFSVAAVVALVDARLETSSFIEAFGHHIPLIALIHEPIEIADPATFSVIAPSLLYEELSKTNETDLLKSEKPIRNLNPYIWKSLTFYHHIGASGRHLTLTIDPKQLLENPNFPEAIKGEIESSLLHEFDASSRTVMVLSPFDERDAAWTQSVKNVFEHVNLPLKIELEFIPRTTLGKIQYFSSLTPLRTRIQKSALVVIFDWGIISGRTIDSLSKSVIEAGASRVLVLVANSQLAIEETHFRESISTLQVVLEKPAKDLLSKPAKVKQVVDYRFIALSKLPLGQYWEDDCPVCMQAKDVLSLPCPDVYIASHRETALNRLLTPDIAAHESNHGTDFMEAVGALRALLVAAQIKTTARFVVKKMLEEFLKPTLKESVLRPSHVALIELLYVEGNWIQLPPLRYRACKEPVGDLCLHAIRYGSEDLRAKAISVLRRVSKTKFIRRAPEIFELLAGQGRALGALLFGIHTYIARRYHETAKMLNPVIDALERLHATVLLDREKETPIFSEVFDSVQYLRFQATFLSSRAESKELDRVEALRRLKTLLSEPNYYAHGVQNQAIERLLSVQFLDAIRDLLKGVESGQNASVQLSSKLTDLLQLRVQAWRDIHKFLTAKIIPWASAARKEFESRQFRECLEYGGGDTQWFLNLLDTHTDGLAPELSPGELLSQLQFREEKGNASVQAGKVLELLETAKSDLTRLLNIILRAGQRAQPDYQERETVKPSLLKEFLDQLENNLYTAVADAVKELKGNHSKNASVLMSKESQPSDYIVCCPRELLRETMLEIVSNNVGNYGVASNENGLHAEIILSLTDKHVNVKIINTYQHVEQVLVDPERHGLKLFNKDLISFGGSLECSKTDTEFIAQLTLRRWREIC